LSDLKKGENAEAGKETPEAQTIKTADTQEARNASAGDMAVVGSARTNASDGSLRKYSNLNFAEQEASIEIVDGDKVGSRKTALTEKDLQAKPAPVKEVEEHSHEQSKELSPEMLSRLEKRETLDDLIKSGGLEEAGSFKLSDLKSHPTKFLAQNTISEQSTKSDASIGASGDGRHGAGIEKESRHVAQLIKNHDYVNAQKVAQNQLAAIEKMPVSKVEKARLEEKFLMDVSGKDGLSYTWNLVDKNVKFSFVVANSHVNVDLSHTALGDSRQFYQNSDVRVSSQIRHDIDAQPNYTVPANLNMGKIEQRLQVLAEKIIPGGTPDEILTYMQEIREANGLGSSDDIKDGQKLSLPGHTSNGDVIFIKDGITTKSNFKEGFVEIENTKTHEATRREVTTNGDFVSFHTTNGIEDQRTTVRKDGSATIVEAGKTPLELTPEEAAKNLAVQRVKLEVVAAAKISDPKELKQFFADVDSFVHRYPPGYLKISSEDAKMEIIKAFTQIDKLLEAETSRLPQPEEQNRIQVAEQLMHHIADPTSVDQGPFPVCQFESLQDRQMLRNPAEAARLVTDIALTGEYTPTNPLMGRTIKLHSSVLAPDKESSGYHIDKGSAARRSYASQLFDAVTVSLALDVTKGDASRKNYHDVHLEQKDGKYFMVQDHKNGIAPEFLDDFIDNRGSSIDSLVRVNAAIVGKAESGFIIVGSAYAKLDAAHQQYGDMLSLGDGVRFLHSAGELTGMLQSIKDSGEWPPILSMESSVDPIHSQWRKARFSGNVQAGGHSEVMTDFDPKTHKASLDGHWGKAADDTGPPHVDLGQIANAILLKTGSRGSNFEVYCKYLNQHPAEFRQFKGALADLVTWSTTNPTDVANQYRAWQARNTGISFQFVNKWIHDHWAEDRDLTILTDDIQRWLKHYPLQK